MEIVNLDTIKTHLNQKHIQKLQEEGFVAYSKGLIQTPPVTHIKMEYTPVNYHIKCGAIKGDDMFVVKLAGGLEQTTKEFGPAKIEGMIIVFSSLTGNPLYLLQDEGYLTSVRTALAGLISAKYLAPKNIKAIGVLGTGTQSKEQVLHLKSFTACKDIYIWGRSEIRASKYKQFMENLGFRVHLCKTPADVAKNCNLIITTTASDTPLLHIEDIQKGTHITAVGADSPGKQELDTNIIKKADIVVVDSKKQCMDHGEVQSAIHLNIIDKNHLIELGQLIKNPALYKRKDSDISVADLTGVSIQDIQIAKSVIESIREKT